MTTFATSRWPLYCYGRYSATQCAYTHKLYEAVRGTASTRLRHQATEGKQALHGHWPRITFLVENDI